MTPSPAEVLTEVARIAKRDLEYEGPIELHMDLQKDLQLDSMSMTVMAVGIENKFRIRLDEAEAGALVTVGDLVALVMRRVSEPQKGDESA